MKARVCLSLLLGPALLAGVILPGCSTAPPSEEAKQSLTSEAQTRLNEMYKADPSLENLVNNANGYVIFPSVGKGGLVIGASYGRGEVYQGGKLVGYADISQGTFGAQIGGQTFAELIVLQTPDALDNLKNNKMELSANVSAVALKSGAAESAKFEHGIAVFTQPTGGVMLEASVGGQRFTFTDANAPQ